MPRIAMAAPATDEDASSTRVDDLIQRGRSQGHLSLSDLRTAFEQAGLTPAEARSILRELSEAGVRLADEETDKGSGLKVALSDLAAVSDATVKGAAFEGYRRQEGPVKEGLPPTPALPPRTADARPRRSGTTRSPRSRRTSPRSPTRLTSTTRRPPWATRCTPT